MTKLDVPYTIYQFWTGDTPISQNRKNAYERSKDVFGVPVKLLYKEDIQKMTLKDHPLHPAYQYLADIHKSDYLRSYFMNFYGGGYADIKYYSKDNNWKECFDLINSNESLDVVGGEEIVGGSPIKELNNVKNIKKIIPNCYFIVRPHSKFSEEWYRRVNAHLDQIFKKLKAHPGKKKTTTYRMIQIML